MYTLDHLLEIRGIVLRRRFGGLSGSTTLNEIEETTEEARLSRGSATLRTFDNRDLRLLWRAPAKTDPSYDPINPGMKTNHERI